ncbi:MAG: hypothetical protein JSS97_11625 [Actinobacteria bacterium]|nr:hypothetical protein [Actinomycetota bacterium]
MQGLVWIVGGRGGVHRLTADADDIAEIAVVAGMAVAGVAHRDSPSIPRGAADADSGTASPPRSKAARNSKPSESAPRYGSQWGDSTSGGVRAWRGFVASKIEHDMEAFL